MSLRDELGAPAVPDFDLELPRGWARHGVDDEALQTMLKAARQRCMEAHQIEMYAELKAQLVEVFDNMRRAGVFAFFCPADPSPGTLAVPASLNASIRGAEPGQTLDDLARMLIRERGAKPLLGDPRTLRLETERTVQLGAETVVNHSAVYLTPLPGTRRRRALALVAGFARTPDVATDAEPVQAMRFMFDACVSTLHWR